MRFIPNGFYATGGPSFFYVCDAAGQRRPDGPRIPIKPAWPVDTGLRFYGGELMGVLVEQDPVEGNRVVMGAVPGR